MYSLQEVMKEPMLLNSQSHDLHHRETVHQINNVPSIRSIYYPPCSSVQPLTHGSKQQRTLESIFFPSLSPTITLFSQLQTLLDIFPSFLLSFYCSVHYSTQL